MSRLFISHSSKDQEAVQQFTEFLVLGMGISRNDLFCTSQSGTLPTGQPFIEHIRHALSDCQQVLCFLTPNYLRSQFCLAELGAAWLQTGKVLPLVVHPLQYNDLRDTPLHGLQMLRQDRAEDLMTLYDELCNLHIAQSGQTAEFTRQLKRYTSSLQQPQLIPVSPDGYYYARIAEIRKTPPQYRCYKLERLLKLDEAPLPEETHWLFYKAGMYEDLAKGDMVRFMIGSSELRKFPDLPCARNIYPDVLEKR